MLLTAFILVIGFVALSGMVARVNQLPDATRAVADRPIYDEAQAMALGIERVMGDVNEIEWYRDDMIPAPPTGVDFITPINDAMVHLQLLESSRGFRLQVLSAPTCTDVAGEAVISMRFALGDTQTRIEFTITHTVRDPSAGASILEDTDPALTCL